MRLRYARGFITGGILGTIAGLMIVPQLNYRSRKNIGRASRVFVDKATDIMENLKK